MLNKYRKLGYYQKDGGGTIDDVEYSNVEVHPRNDYPTYFDLQDLCEWIYDCNDGWE